MHIIIFEGCRGTGKSTLTFKLRQKIPETTLINCTGFIEDGHIGLGKVCNYYESWMKFLYEAMSYDLRFIFDRFFFTEYVFSKLYKEYNFEEFYNILLSNFTRLADLGVEIDILFLTIDDKNELKKRLTRDKVPFKVKESVEESLKQQNIYRKMFADFKSTNPNIKIHHLRTDNKTIDDLYNEVVETVNFI